MSPIRGALPPHTPSGMASYSSATVSYAPGSVQRTTLGHRAMLLSWRCDPDALRSLLPEPLEPAQAPGAAYLMVGETQALRSPELTRTMPVHLLGWTEARILIPCRLGELEGAFAWVSYRTADGDAGIEHGLYEGLLVKGATFSLSFPFRGQPLNREIAAGSVARAIATRFDQRILDASFTAAVPAADAARASAFTRFERQFGIRYMPDWGNPSGPPLVHDLVVWEPEELTVADAWSGEGRVRFDPSADDELALLAPLEMGESHYAHLTYRLGPGTCRRVHDYLAAPAASSAPMGAERNGASPPFSPSGRTAMAASTPMGTRPGQAGHMGILTFFRVDRANVESLLPPPLEPVADSDVVSLFLNQTQSGLNRHQPPGDDSLAFLADVSPHHMNWHEAFVKIPASLNGRRMYLFTFLHVDVDFKIVQGIYNGFVAKLARFRTLYPMEGHPGNEAMEPGRVARAVVSRHDQRLITLSFEAQAECSADERTRIVPWENWTRNCGVRAFPDYARPGAPPLVHQLVLWDMQAGEYARAWRGRAELAFGGSEYDELSLLAPLEMLESYFVHYQYRSRPGLLEVVHDYVADPIPGLFAP